ncbi:unnamed protein product, partial [Callosobruchus maculatus]
MAQFVTHIQPTLIESSQHHTPHHHHKDHHGKEHYSKDHHGKDHHGKDHHGKEHHHGTSKSHKGDHHSHEHHPGPRDFPFLPPTPAEHHRHEQDYHHDYKRDSSGHYVDSHGVPHAFEMHFIDSQGIRRDYHGDAIEKGHHEMEKSDKEKSKRKDQKSPFKEELGGRPTPPQFIDVHPVHLENKLHVSTLTHSLHHLANVF